MKWIWWLLLRLRREKVVLRHLKPGRQKSIAKCWVLSNTSNSSKWMLVKKQGVNSFVKVSLCWLWITHQPFMSPSRKNHRKVQPNHVSYTNHLIKQKHKEGLELIRSFCKEISRLHMWESLDLNNFSSIFFNCQKTIKQMIFLRKKKYDISSPFSINQKNFDLILLLAHNRLLSKIMGWLKNFW